jgi:hypothetical protein
MSLGIIEGAEIIETVLSMASLNRSTYTQILQNEKLSLNTHSDAHSPRCTVVRMVSVSRPMTWTPDQHRSFVDGPASDLPLFRS